MTPTGNCYLHEAVTARQPHSRKCMITPRRLSFLPPCRTLVRHIAKALLQRVVQIFQAPWCLKRISKSSGGCVDWVSHLLIRKFWIHLNVAEPLAMRIQEKGRFLAIQSSGTVALHAIDFKQSTNQCVLVRVIKGVTLNRHGPLYLAPFWLPISRYLNCEHPQFEDKQ